MKYLISLDQGTTSSKTIIFDEHGTMVSMAQKEITQIYPRPGWVEHDPIEIWQSQVNTARQAITQGKIELSDIAALGIANQRETIIAWDKKTSNPLCNAIVWQDRRTESNCTELRNENLETKIKEKTGLRIDPYFSGTKISWILKNVSDAEFLLRKNRLAFGTVDSWLIWMLTDGKRHLTDISNASRTMLLNIETGIWDNFLLSKFNIPSETLPKINSSSEYFGHTQRNIFGKPIPICGVAGDQQSALFGQTCFEPGIIKNTYGTGCFMLTHLADKLKYSKNGLITTRAAQTSHNPCYALEGSVFIGGAVVQWIKDGLKAISKSEEIEKLALNVPDSGGVIFVPAFSGLGAPYWRPDLRGSISGITRGTTIDNIAYAALESIAFQSCDLIKSMNIDLESNGMDRIRELRVDGGACANDLLLQIQSDLSGIPVVRPNIIETTALGVAYLAGLKTGVFKDENFLKSHWKIKRIFYPKITKEQRLQKINVWEKAVNRLCQQ
ncbi:MAG: glycerol kinase [Betaproteobacteria bacterium TMED156]|nr:MAG: glycerol kinase [Betaproteobacteria bacterium TMED156]